MKLTGIIKKCEYTPQLYANQSRIKCWITLDTLRTITLEELGTVAELAKKFGLNLLSDVIRVDSLIGRTCRIQHKNERYSFVALVS